MTTKKMRLRSSKRNNKAKTPKRKTNKSFTKKRNSSKKEKKNSRRVRKQRGGGEISDEDLLKKIKDDFREYMYRTEAKQLLNLSLDMMLPVCMGYIDPKFWRLKIEEDINAAYVLYHDKIIKLFNDYIDYLSIEATKYTYVYLISINIYINVDLDEYYYVAPNKKKLQFSTQIMNELLFDVVINKLLEKEQIYFRLFINNEIEITFHEKANIDKIVEDMAKFKFPKHFINLFIEKLMPFKAKLNPSSETLDTNQSLTTPTTPTPTTPTPTTPTPTQSESTPTPTQSQSESTPTPTPPLSLNLSNIANARGPAPSAPTAPTQLSFTNLTKKANARALAPTPPVVKKIRRTATAIPS